MRHEGSTTIRELEFSPDGKFILADGSDSAPYRLWAAPPDSGKAPTPSWLLRLATICAGKRLNEEGEFASAADEVAKMDEIRRELAALPNDAPDVEWGRWFLADRAKRSIAPGLTITPAVAEKRAKEMGAEATSPAGPATRPRV